MDTPTDPGSENNRKPNLLIAEDWHEPVKHNDFKVPLILVAIALFGFGLHALVSPLRPKTKQAASSSASSSQKAVEQNRLTALGTPLWLPGKTALKLAPYRLADDVPMDKDGKFLKFDVVGSLAIYESPALHKNQTPACGSPYQSDIIIAEDTAGCRAIGTIQPNVTAMTNNSGAVYATFGTTLVVLRPTQYDQISSDELVGYLKTFHQISAPETTKLLTQNYSQLKAILARQAELANFKPLLPPGTPPAGYRVQEMALVGLADPEKPTLRVTYEKGDNITLDLWTAPLTPAFQPPANCGPSLDIDYGGHHPCHLLETTGANSIYASDDAAYLYVRSGDTVSVLDPSPRASTDDSLAVARSLVLTSQDIFKKAITTKY